MFTNFFDEEFFHHGDECCKDPCGNCDEKKDASHEKKCCKKNNECADHANQNVEDLINTIKDQQNQIAEKDQQIIRIAADMSNISKRHAKVIEDTENFAISKFAFDMLSVLDNLEKALENANQQDSLKEGIEITLKEFIRVLKMNNISKIDSNGEKFNAEFHEAVSTITNPDHENDIVVETLRSGYKIGKDVQRCLRPAMVVVNKK